MSGGYAKAFSTNGRPVELPTSIGVWVTEIASQLKEGTVIDGIYMEGAAVEWLSGVPNRKAYVVTDCVPLDLWKEQGVTEFFEERRKILEQAYKQADIPFHLHSPVVILSKGKFILDEDELHSLYLEALNCDCPGLIFKHCNSPYPFETDSQFVAWKPSMRIVCDGVRWEGGVDGELLVASKDRVFPVGAGFAPDERERLHKDKKLEGKKVEILVQSNDAGGVRFARFLRFI